MRPPLASAGAGTGRAVTTPTEPQTWRMFAGRRGDEWVHAGDPRFVRSYGREPIPVVLAEDESGTHYGWIHDGEDIPRMVQPSWSLFAMQFPRGPKSEAARGKGRIVRLTIAPTEE